MTRLRTAVLALLLTAVPVAAQIPGASPYFSHLSGADGLRQNSVSSIIQDSDGFLWLGTEHGLHRFDGYRFPVFQHDPYDVRSLSDNHIHTVIEAQDASLWIATSSGGINRLDKSRTRIDRFQHQADDPSSLAHDRVWSVVEDQDGRIWAATESGLDLREGDGFRHYRHDPRQPESLASDFVRSLLVDRSGRLWIGSFRGLNFIERGSDRIQRFSLPEVSWLDEENISALLEDREGNLWIGSQGRMARLSPDRTQATTLLEDASPGLILTLLEDQRGDIWIGTDGVGLFRWREQSGTLNNYRHDPIDDGSIGDDTVLAAYEDATGVLWFGTSSGGVSRLHPATESFAHYRRSHAANSLPSNMVWAFHEDADGSAWIATADGLAHMDAEGVIQAIYQAPAVPGLSTFFAVFRDSRGELWAGVDEGLLHWNQTAEAFEFVEIFPQPVTGQYIETVHLIREDTTGRLWLGTFNGLVRFDPQTGVSRVFTTTSGKLADDWIIDVKMGRDGTLWLGSDAGLARMDMETGEVLETRRRDEQDPTSLSHDSVQSILIASDGSLWAGTASGLNRQAPGARGFTRYTRANGLPGDYVYAIQEDVDANIWASTDRGLFRLDPHTGEIKGFESSDGLQGSEFNTGASLAGPSGRLYFGGLHGFNLFDPTAVVISQVPPRIAITAASISGSDGVRTIDGILSNRVELGHRESVLAIEFSAFDFKAPDENRFRYRLAGFDREWRDGGRRNDATYTNLDPGRYRFHVRAANSDGVWSSSEATLDIVVKPPPWQTMPAYVLYVLLFSLFIWWLVRSWTERLRSEHLLRSEQQKRDLAERLQRFTQALSATLDARSVATELLSGARDLVPHDFAVLYLEREGVLELIHSSRCPPEVLETLAHFPGDHGGLLNELSISGEAMVLDEGQLISARLSGSALWIPFSSSQGRTGALLLGRLSAAQNFGAEDRRIGQVLANQALVAFNNAQLFAEVERLATTDGLTGLYNRRHFLVQAEREFQRSLRYSTQLSVVLLDADEFKRVNDEYGHLVGDEVLRALARICRNATRATDIVGRYGGEEFIVLLPETDLSVAGEVAQRIRVDVADSTLSTRGIQVRITVSVGVASRVRTTTDLSSLIAESDRALYAAKRGGRDRIVTAAGG